MSLARFFQTCLLTSLLISAAGAQDSIEGDIPAGQPFDGTGDRASMFQLYQIANITTDVVLDRAQDTDLAFFSVLEQVLSAKGYLGIRFFRLAQDEEFDRSCSPDGVIEVRVRRQPTAGGVAVEVASQYWFSHGQEAQENAPDDGHYARECMLVPQ